MTYKFEEMSAEEIGDAMNAALEELEASGELDDIDEDEFDDEEDD